MHAASLTTVEGLLQEFYQPSTSNARKREIETNLLAFKSQPEAWQLCLRVATASDITVNQFLWFFSTSTVEHTITRRWTQLTSTDKTLLRETLWNSYAQLGATSNVAKRQRDTLAQLIALLGKREFPEQDPNYMQHCMELTKTRFQLGINLLRITSEEVVSNRGDLTTEWKQYFYSCISMCVPDVLDLVTKYLLIAVCHINGKDIQSTIPNTLMDFSLTSALPNDNQLSSSILDLLDCVQHLVSWIRTELISEYFLMSILDLSQWRPAHEPISLVALSVLNELLYLQKPLPFEGPLMGGVTSLLEQHNNNRRQSEMYSDKFRELLRLYTKKYAGKLMQEPDLLETFLNLLYSCTTELNGALDFTEKLEIWTPIIKGIAQQPAKITRYNNVLTQLVDEIMRRTQFEANKPELEVLENELMENDTFATEWQQFLDQCFESLALLANTRGAHIVFAQVYNHWSRPQMYLLSLEHALDHGSARSYEAARKLKGANVGEILRDFATVCQAVVRLAPLMDSSSAAPGVAEEMECQLQMLSDSLLQTLQLLASNRLYSGGSEMDKATFQTDLDNLYAQVLLAMRSIFPLTKAMSSEELLHRLFAILGSIFACNGSLSAASPIVQQTASELLLFISTVIRPKCLLDIPQIQSLLQAGSRLGAQLPRQVCINVHISLVSYMVLPWKNVPEQQQEYPRRLWMLREYVQGLAQNFLDLDLVQANESKVAATTLSLLGTFTALIEYFKATGGNAKDMLASSFKPILTKALMIFNSFGQSSIAMAITVAEFSLSMLRTLPTHLGAQFIKEMITLFISVSSREQLTLSRLAVMEKILQMFKLIVEQPGSASLGLLPSILDFSTQQILPLLQQQNAATDNSEITSLLYALFDSVLTCKWQFFYKNQLSNGHSGGGSGNFNCSDNLHPVHFMAILNAYGQMLVSGTDPSNVRSVLFSMQNVNERSRLYQRALFKEQLLASFQRALLNLLLSGEGSLHFDMIAQALYAMGQVDRRQLLESFVHASLPVAHTSLEEICQTNDIPTFTQKLTQLMQDAHCVHLNETA
ncbi:exportin-6-A [Drosophila erecta]|uniref:Exportin 6, isoform A n=2 Tax=Drosophila erecta TaxID=7220 RepID=B3P965_DROER|nr:exportin-6-A [Drosophila erecta]EDV45361.1 exportin 6, isoform A [Drosophila erecta]KQS25942.1 exportin 6, isoform B [Drosophila erecta]